MKEQLSGKFLIQDRIYGEVEIDNPVLIDLINSFPVQRLKGINQLGIPDEFYHIRNFSRYEHSIGVMLLLKKLEASEEEQISGLLHDVSHRAFSHVYDWVVRDSTRLGNNETDQDERHIDFVRNSEIPIILENHGYSPEKVLHCHQFGLLERDIPDLCADRVDYSLRELPADLAHKISCDLMVINNIIVCRSFATASQFGRGFLGLQTGHWGGYEAVVRYYHFARVLKRGLVLQIISPEDFWADDEYVISKLKNTTDRQILDILEKLRQKRILSSDSGVVVYKKFRYIDPLFNFNTHNGLAKLSEVDFEFSQMVEDAREQNREGVMVPEQL